MTPAVLAVDAGQTEIRAALADGGGRGPAATATAAGVRRMGGRFGPDDVAAALMAAVAGLGPLPRSVRAVGVGLSGFEAASEEDLGRIGELLRRELATARLSIASDGLTSLLGALGDRDGSVVAAGTGTVCVGRRGEGLVKVDGWGALLGDAGSGFAIGRAGLESGLRHADGRDGSAALLRAAERRYAPLPDLPERIYRAPAPVRAVAAFAEDVGAAAAAGDEQALAILDDAGRELALTACAALERLFDPADAAVVSWAGNLFRVGARLVEPFRGAVAERRPGSEVVEPAADSLIGAALLAELEGRLRPERGILWTAA